MRHHLGPRERDLLSFDALPDRLIGRDHQLAMLRDALSSACSGAAVTALVHGPKGAGKSALIRSFLRDERGLARVLEGARDDGSPFASVRPIAIAIAERAEAAPHRAALSLLFPEIGERGPPPEPTLERLREARAALRDAIAAVAKAEPVILVADDVAAWDEDSRALLRALPAPGALLVLAYRSDDAIGAAPAKALIRRLARGAPTGDVREIVVLDVPEGAAQSPAIEPQNERVTRGDEALARLAFHRATERLRAEIAAKEGDRRAYVAAAIEAGRLVEAAGALLHEEPPHRAAAALLLIRAGAIDAGFSEAERAIGPSVAVMPRSRARSLASKIYQRARLSLRGLDVPRSRLRDEPADHGALGALVRALAELDLRRASGLSAWLLRSALDGADRSAIVEALVCSAMVRAAEGDEGGIAAARDRAARAASIAADPAGATLAACASVAVHVASSSFDDAAITAENARGSIVAGGPRARALAAALDDQRALALAIAGRFGDLGALLADSLDDAEEQGDLARVARLSILFGPLVALADDRPHAARSPSLGPDALEEIAQRVVFESPPLFARRIHVIALSLLYEGFRGAARASVLEHWPALDERGALDAAMIRVDLVALRAATAIAAREPGARMEVYLETAERDATAVAREGSPYAKAHALALEALLAAARGRARESAERFDDAETAFDAMGMALHAAACAYRRGEMMGTDEGVDLATAADQRMRSLGVREPAKMAFALLPVG